jgi:hypothetical protein
MRIEGLYSHLNGHEWLLVHQPRIWEEIESVVTRLDAAKFKTKESREKDMLGKLIFSPKALNAEFKRLFQESGGWGESRTQYWVTDDQALVRRTMHLPASEQKRLIEAEGKRPIRSYNQTDFLKNRVAIEIQLGKYSFIAYDLFVKHLAFYIGDTIDVGVEILPMKSMQEQMSSGPGYFEGALYDVVRQGRGVPAVPLVLVGVSP